MSKISRRNFVRGGLASGAAIAAASCNPNRGPTVITNKIKDVTLRLIGTGAAQINDIRVQAEKDLGFKIRMRALSTAENIQIAITQPKQYDIFDGEYFSLPLVAPSGNLQPIKIQRIKEFDKLTPIFTTGELYSGAPVNTSQGTAPRKVMFLKSPDSTEFAPGPTNWATMIPFQYNADTLGYRPDLVSIKDGITWTIFLDNSFPDTRTIKAARPFGRAKIVQVI